MVGQYHFFACKFLKKENWYHVNTISFSCILKSSLGLVVGPQSCHARSVAIFFSTARFYHSTASTMKYRRRNVSMHISYCVCFGGNREPRGHTKNYLTSKSSLRDARVTVKSCILAISRFDRFAVEKKQRLARDLTE